MAAAVPDTGVGTAADVDLRVGLEGGAGIPIPNMRAALNSGEARGVQFHRDGPQAFLQGPGDCGSQGLLGG